MSAFFDITGPLKHTEQLATLWGEKSAFSINEVAGIILLQLNKLEFAGFGQNKMEKPKKYDILRIINVVQKLGQSAQY